MSKLDKLAILSKIILHFVLVITFGVLIFSMFIYIETLKRELQIKEETYIFAMYDEYKRNIQECSDAVTSLNTEVDEVELDKIIEETCIDTMNGLNDAKVIKNWGYDYLLK